MKQLSASELERRKVILQVREHRKKMMREKKDAVVTTKKSYRYGK